MKRFVIGLLCGVALCISVGAAASSTIQAVRYPSSIRIHTYDGMSEVRTDHGAILNYNNRVYVPLRSFAELMGAKLRFTPATASELPHIDIIADSSVGAIQISESELFSDVDHYLSVGYLKSSGSTKNTLDTGIIKIHKDITDKAIEIVALGKDGGIVGRSDYVHIYQQELSPPKPGDIRSFRTNLNLTQTRAVHSYKVTIRDFRFLWPEFDRAQNDGYPMAFTLDLSAMYPGIEETQSLKGPYGELKAGTSHKGAVAPFFLKIKQGSILPLSIYAVHTGEGAGTFDSFSMDLVVRKLHGDRSETTVLTRNVAVLSGSWKTGESYTPKLYWDLTDQLGVPLDKGTYRLSLEIPSTIQYRVDGETKTRGYKPFVKLNDYLINIE